MKRGDHPAAVLLTGRLSTVGEKIQRSRLCGLTLRERNLKVLQFCGISSVNIVGPFDPQEYRDLIDKSSHKAMTIDFHQTGSSANRLLDICEAITSRSPMGLVFLNNDCVYDGRLIDRVIASEPSTLVVSPRPSPAAQQIGPYGGPYVHKKHIVEAIYSCGLGLLNRQGLQVLFAEGENCGGFLLTGLPVDTDSLGARLRLLNLEEICPYVVDMRRSIPIVAFQVKDQDDLRAGEKILVDSTQKGILDFPARYIHPKLENWAVLNLCPTSISPNQITILSNLIAFSAAALFWYGFLHIAVVLAFTVGVLDGVDGKLARVKMQYSEFGGLLDHILDNIYEPLWYLAIGSFLNRRVAGWPTLEISVAIIVLYFVDRLITGAFKHLKSTLR